MLARGRAIGLRERVEDAPARLVGHANAGVVHFEAQGHALGVLGRHHHLDRDLAAVGKFDSVAQQVEDHLAQPVGVAADGDRDVAGHVQFQPQALGLGLRRKHVVDIGQQVAEIELDIFDRELAGFDLGKVEDVVDDHQQVLARALDHAGVVALLFRQARGQQQLRHAQHAVHRGADLVAHGGQEGALRLAGGLGRVLGLFQLLGAHAHLAFELVAVLGQGAVARLHLGQHVVEAVDQRTEVVAALVQDAFGRLAAADQLRGGDQARHRFRHAATRTGGNQQRRHEGKQGRNAGGAQAFQDLEPHRQGAALEHDHAARLAPDQDRPDHPIDRLPQRAVATNAAADAVGWQHVRCCLARPQARRTVARQQRAVAVVHGCLQQLAIMAKRLQLPGELLAVGALEHAFASSAEHRRQRGQPVALVFLAVQHRGGGKREQHQQQRAAGREHGKDGQSLAEARTFVAGHCGGTLQRWTPKSSARAGSSLVPVGKI
ncbi:hypothetical protein DUPY_13310 [Duganella phyllosphaerae]|uniref:Uncharacterized protein n=1 Tax=Duganella phyllosphaerae TaxID=762836 RepID=A0A1E7X437_9BURK|nr:hypothetical protein DUPY_13310 [Duganella phyllosphaerae]